MFSTKFLLKQLSEDPEWFSCTIKKKKNPEENVELIQSTVTRNRIVPDTSALSCCP